jgi:hypothetical protein
MEKVLFGMLQRHGVLNRRFADSAECQGKKE